MLKESISWIRGLNMDMINVFSLRSEPHAGNLQTSHQKNKSTHSVSAFWLINKMFVVLILHVSGSWDMQESGVVLSK